MSLHARMRTESVLVVDAAPDRTGILQQVLDTGEPLESTGVQGLQHNMDYLRKDEPWNDLKCFGTIAQLFHI